MIVRNIQNKGYSRLPTVELPWVNGKFDYALKAPPRSNPVYHVYIILAVLSIMVIIYMFNARTTILPNQLNSINPRGSFLRKSHSLRQSKAADPYRLKGRKIFFEDEPTPLANNTIEEQKTEPMSLATPNNISDILTEIISPEETNNGTLQVENVNNVTQTESNNTFTTLEIIENVTDIIVPGGNITETLGDKNIANVTAVDSNNEVIEEEPFNEQSQL